MITGRAAWGARYSDGVGPAPIPASEMWLHHTDTAPPADSLPAEYAAMRQLEDIGQFRFGAGISYTWCVMPSGRVYQGHSPGREGTHTYGHNTAGRAVVLVGDHTTTPPSQAQIRAVADLLVEAQTRGWTARASLTGGHRDVVTTACPGDAAYPWIAAINRMAGEGVAYALDYSSGRPTAAAVLAAGYVGVVRYIGFPDRGKCVTTGEYADMVRHGVGVALIFENQAGDMLGGRTAGRAAAQLARSHARAVGFPDGRPIYYACDTDIVSLAARLGQDAPRLPMAAGQMAAVLDYLRGAIDVEGAVDLVGVYGEHDVMEAAAAAGVATWFWQTRAWSHGVISGRAHLVQEIGTYVVGGVGCDRNTISAADWGQTGAQEVDTMTAADVAAIRADVAAVQADVDAVQRTLDMVYRGDPGSPPAPQTHPANIRSLWSALTDAQQSALLRNDAQQTAALASVAAQVAALTAVVEALVQQAGGPGGLTAEQAHLIALDAANQAVDGITVTVHGDPAA